MANVTETSSSNPKIINYNNNPLPTIKVPFPPEINAKDLIAHRESPDGTKKLTTRAPNAFIIFRKQFVKTARDEGHFLPMTVISSMASVAWENEKEEVRVEYKRIAREAHIQRKAMCPKSNNRRKRKEKWNLVSFIPSTSVNKPGSKMVSNKSTTNIITAGNGNNNITGNTTNDHIINNHNNHITNDLLPVKSEPDTITCHEINENYFAQYYPNLSYTSYNENSDLSYNSYNESPNLSYTSYSDDNTSPNTNININSNLNLNLNSNTNINTNPNTDLYGNTERYPSPYLMGIPTINIPDDNNNHHHNNNNDNHDLQEYNSIIENNIQQNNLYNDDDNWNLENGIISNLSASPSNSFSDFTSNASSSPSIASPSIISLDTPTSALATSDFTDFTEFTFNNTTPIITQNNYEIMDFSSIYNDTIMQPLVMMQ